ncbi:hypothetical protein J4231_03340 [Candidatus Woesearchaeota archaeon]|nr:hypothetical protein [Candidatus Woesearchaeota archaeon]
MALKKHTLDEIDLFYSDDILHEVSKSPGMFVEDFMSDLHEYNGKELELIGLYSKKQGLKRTAMIVAHGDSIGEEWRFFCGNKSFSTQEWINQNDGRYALLILGCCNPGHHEIESKKSAVLAPNEVYSPIKHYCLNEVQIEVYIPGIGYVDSYTVDYEIKRVQRALKRKIRQQQK